MSYPKLAAENLIKEPRWLKILVMVILFGFLFSTFLLIFTPWQQTSEGTGRIIAIDPNDRIQNINSTVPGRVNRWFVSDGSVVKKGDPIVEIVDNDPNFMERLRIERDAVLRNFEAKKIASETALLNYKRQKELFANGLSSRVKFEKAKIEYKKLLSDEAEAAAKLATSEVKLSRQETQLITASRDGTILRVLHGSGSVIVNEGDVLAVFVPKTLETAAEVYVEGNDLPLIYPGRKVRLQFEGWPAVQISGWPSVAIGTFSGVVQSVDPSASQKGKFRVIILPEDNTSWPNSNFLRQGTRTYAWVMLSTVSLGYELWRQFNGFPPALDDQSKQDTINFLQDEKKKSKKTKDEK